MIEINFYSILITFWIPSDAIRSKILSIEVCSIILCRNYVFFSKRFKLDLVLFCIFRRSCRRIHNDWISKNLGMSENKIANDQNRLTVGRLVDMYVSLKPSAKISYVCSNALFVSFFCYRKRMPPNKKKDITNVN